MIAPTPSEVPWPTDQAFSPEEVSFEATDNIELKGWFLPVSHSTRAVILLHGVSANRLQMLPRALWLRGLGYNVFLYDARGCGESAEVHPTFGYRETRDLLGAVRWLQARGMKQLACLGFSQGAATILLASNQLPPMVKVVIAEASYATLQATVDDHFRANTGLPSGYAGCWAVPLAAWKLGFQLEDVSPVREIARLKIPVYLIGGTGDRMAPAAGVQKLYDTAVSEKMLWLIEGAGHGDFFYAPDDAYQKRVGAFLGKHL